MHIYAYPPSKEKRNSDEGIEEAGKAEEGEAEETEKESRTE
jgi:hypothetical protein